MYLLARQDPHLKHKCDGIFDKTCVEIKFQLLLLISMMSYSVIIPPPRNNEPEVFSRDFAEQHVTLLMVTLLTVTC